MRLCIISSLCGTCLSSVSPRTFDSVSHCSGVQRHTGWETVNPISLLPSHVTVLPIKMTLLNWRVKYRFSSTTSGQNGLCKSISFFLLIPSLKQHRLTGFVIKCVLQICEAPVVLRFIHGFNTRLHPFPVRFVSAELILCQKVDRYFKTVSWRWTPCYLKGAAGAVDHAESRLGQLSACQRMVCCSVWLSGSKYHQLYKTTHTSWLNFIFPAWNIGETNVSECWSQQAKLRVTNVFFFLLGVWGSLSFFCWHCWCAHT